jgi:hypothetical protein
MIMGKYEPIARKLREASNDELSLSLSEIEDILKFKLPPSARKHRAWWSNSYKGNHSQAQGWIGAGWETRDIDMTKQSVRFVRTAKAGRMPRDRENMDLWDKARQYSGISDRTALERAAVEALIRQHAVEELIKLGGTMPDFKAAPRRRDFA